MSLECSDMEVDESSSPAKCKSRGRKSKNLAVAPSTSSLNTSVNEEERWFNAQEKLRSNMHLLNSSTDESDERNQILSFLEEICVTINNFIKTQTAASPIFTDLIQSFIEILNCKNVNKKIRLDAVKIIITLHNQNNFPLAPKNYVAVICFLLENCCQNQPDKTLTPFVRDLRKLLVNIRKEEIIAAFLEDKSKITNLLNTLLNRVQFCCTDIGRDVIAGIVSLNNDFLKAFHEYVKRFLVSCKRSEAQRFGKLYHRIWDLLEDDRQKMFEERYIQWLMQHAFTLDRRKPPVRCLSLNLQSLLQGLHLCRQKAKFSNVITDLYSPIIWKYLNSNNNIHRSNAAEIFMDVYPLERKGKSAREYSVFLRKQHDELLTLLDDPCPTVRVIAIKAACTNLRYFWLTFQNGSAEKIIEKFVTELVTDGSSCEVRKAVYQGLTALLLCEDSHPLLKGVLPSLGGFIHDENQGVRQAFILMLIQLKSLGTPVKYWKIVDLHNVAVRLADDSPKNRELIVHLIFSSFFNTKITPEQTYLRLSKFISANPNAIRYLAMYSSRELAFQDAVRIMRYILKIMGDFVEKKMKVLGDVDTNQEPEATANSSKSKTHNKAASDAGNASDDEKENTSVRNTSISSTATDSSELGKATNILDPRITHGLLDFVGMLWLIHGKELHDGKNKELLDKLYNSSVKCLKVVLRYFRDTHAYFGALNLASFVPMSIMYHETTAFGVSVSFLRQMEPDTPDNEIRCVIQALCRWKRGNEVIGVAKEWLDETFRSEALNESFAPEERKRQKKVRFHRPDPKPKLALRILNELFSSTTTQRSIFSSEVQELKSLLDYLSRIKILIDRRLDKESEISTLITDEVLVEALIIYGNLIIMFNENNVEGFDFWPQFIEYLDWCNSVVVRSCSIMPDYEEILEDNFISKVLHVPLVQSLNLIAIGKFNDEQIVTLLKFCESTLNSNCGLQFVEISVHLLKQLVLFSRVHHAKNRQTEIMTFWFPCIMGKILDLVTEKFYSKIALSSCIKDIPNLKRNLIYIYILAGKLYPELTHSSPAFKMMLAFCNALINVLLFPITECETLNLDPNLKNLPVIGSFLVSIFISQCDLSSALLYVLKTVIERFSEKDGLHLLATTSLLYTFAFSESKISKPEVLKVVKLTYQKLQDLPAEEGHVAVVMNREQTILDRTIIDVEEATESAVKEVGQCILKKIAEHLGGSLS